MSVNVHDDVATALWPVKATLGFYIGGMGAKGRNFHTELMARMGFEKEAFEIQDLFFAGRRDEAIAAVPDDFADEISLCGPRERIAERLEAWKASPVTDPHHRQRRPDGPRAHGRAHRLTRDVSSGARWSGAALAPGCRRPEAGGRT